MRLKTVRLKTLRLTRATSVAVVALVLTATAASAAPYPPPAQGVGTASPSRVKQGHCTHFRGDGFAPSAQLKIYDNDRPAGITTASSDGEFTVRHCFANDAQVGQHVLKAAGANAQTLPGDPSSREVTATVTVTGVEETASADDTDVNDAQPAASSTSLVSPFSLGVLGLLLMPLLSGLLLLFERRHRRRRRAA